MIRANFLSLRRSASLIARTKVSSPIWHQLILVASAGLASAALGQVFGRMLHLTWPIPASGSIVAALPRTIILLMLLLRVNRFGVLTAAGVAEIGAKLTIGVGGMWPMFLIAPLVGNLAGDLLWYWLRRLPVQRVGLMLTGATICVARVLVALFFWSLLRPAMWNTPENLGSLLVCIVATNIALGAIAGFVVGRRKKFYRPAEKE